MNTKEIDEMKKLGIIKRKSEEKEGEIEYTFKLTCKDCGGKLDGCNCTKTLEDAKKVIASEKRWYCWECACKVENCDKDVNDQIAEMMREFPSTTRQEAYTEIMSEGWDGPESYESDGVEYWDCDCATGI